MNRQWSFAFIFIFLCLTLSSDFGTLAAQASASSPPARDGPAELPRVYVQTALSDTPANGKIWETKTGGDFQDALNVAQCGDVIRLQAGATFAGQFRLPAKSCDDRHWIIIRTSASDSALPAEGSRLTPCFAAVPQLPGRPPLHCAGTDNVTAKIMGVPPLNSEGKPVDHYRFVGLEIAQPLGSKPSALLGLGVNSHHVVIDRCWIHGNATDDTQRAIALNGSHLAVVDSTITDIHTVATDTQGIAAWRGAGPLKIVNNFIEGGSSSIGFGGSGSTVTPRDIEIRNNHLFKPWSWRIGDPSFIGVTFNSKVALESKNSSRVLVEGNILENVWGGPQGGDGDAVWLGPKNQNNECPSCEVDDITFRYNIIRHAGGGLYIFDAPSDAGGIAQQAARYSIHDNLFEDIRMEYAGQGNGRGLLFRLLGAERFPPPREISIQHNTGIADGGILQILSTPQSPLVNFTFRDNLVSDGQTAISGCKGRFGTEVLEDCAHGFTFENNVVVDSPRDLPKSNGNFQKDRATKVNLYPKHWRDVGFADAGEHGKGDYRLCSGPDQPAPSCVSPSRYLGAGTDSKHIGADVSKIYELTEKIE